MRVVKKLSKEQCLDLLDRGYWNYYLPYYPDNQYYITVVSVFKIRLFHQIYI